MPADICDTLSPVLELDVAITMLKDIYAMKPEPPAVTGEAHFQYTTPLN